MYKRQSNTSYELSAGNYEVPADVLAGKYDIVAVSGHGNFKKKGNDGYYDLSEILGVDNDTFYIKDYKNAKFVEGDIIEISGTLKTQLIPKN